MMVVVVVLPSEPVTAMMGQGQTSEKGLHLGGDDAAPGHGRPASSGTSGRRPGVRKITSWSRPCRYSVAQPQRGSGGLQLLRQSAQLRPVAAVAGGDGDALPQQQAQRAACC